MFSKFLSFIILLLLIVSSGCVTQKKYNELLAEKVALEGDFVNSQDSLHTALENIESLEELIATLKNDTSELGNSIRETTDKLASLDTEHKELETYYNNLLNNSGKLNKDLAEQQARLMEMRDNLEETKRLNDELATDLAERERKVVELEDVLAKKDAAVNGLKKKISDALLSFKESDLTVDVRNGKVYVSLAEQLLFQSGSIAVDPKGQQALKQLANAIKDQKDISILVEGHTDNVPISRTSQYMKNNWDLSVMRATSIVKILTDAGLEPKQVTAAGRGEFFPVSDNESADGRSSNRRTEIIITPNLDEIFKLLENN